MRNLYIEGNLCMEDLKAIGYSFPKRIEFVVSNRMKSTWGLCTTSNRRNYTEIKIASFLLQDDVEERYLRQTIYHELAHAIDENKHGHGKEWQKIADCISDCYNMDIQQYCTEDEIDSLKKTTMYQEKCTKKMYSVVCTECGNKYTKKSYRAPKWYAHVENFHCNKILYGCKCGGKLKRV